MAVSSGKFPIGPDAGQLTIHASGDGLGPLGHEVILAATVWDGTIELNRDSIETSAVSVTIDSRSLELQGLLGHVQETSPSEHVDLFRSVEEHLLRTKEFPEISFTSVSVFGTIPKLTVNGHLTLVGQTRPATLDVTVDDVDDGTKMVGRTSVKQTDFGIKPFSALFGAVKIHDRLDVQVAVHLA